MKSTLDAIEVRLCDFFASDLGWEGDRSELLGEDPLTLAKFLDSEELLEVVTFLEDEYGIEIEDEEIAPEHFNTVSDVARMVASKLPDDLPG